MDIQVDAPLGEGKLASHTPEEGDPFHIVAESATHEHRRVLKHGDTFAVFDHFGEFPSNGNASELGLFHQGTRFLSGLTLQSWNGRPLLLSSRMRDDNNVLLVDCTNPDVSRHGRLAIERGIVHLRRTIVLCNGACHIRLAIQNYGLGDVRLPLAWHFDADYVDVFEVRGMHRERRGRWLEPTLAERSSTLSYLGLDGVERRTRLQFSRTPRDMSPRCARFEITIPPGGAESFDVAIECLGTGSVDQSRSFDDIVAAGTEQAAQERSQSCRVTGSHDHFNAWIDRAVSDLRMMTTETAFGPYPYAGVPWFSTPFGRDGIITALECLWLDPRLARGVLAFLAATQATDVNPAQDAEPGKILHETRQGEMAALGEIPFARYYGSVDSTPLFVWLAGEYWKRTADLPFIKSIWPQISLALAWMKDFGDIDGDGFLEYARHSKDGLVQQGWKDSHDSVFHADGVMAAAPIALCEVQGYAFAAWEAGAAMAEALGEHNEATVYSARAETVRRRFDEAFWCDDIDTYAIALDAEKKPCRVRSSNAGQCLMTGIVPRDRARRVGAGLFDAATFSGWGVRTLSAKQTRFNPMSYHNGSVWPHDNAMVAAGLARYGLKDQVLQIMRGQFEASRHMDLHRLPELFCGFARIADEPPTLYPVACSPQAWAAAAVFMLLQSCLGLCVSAVEQRLTFEHPVLPNFLERLHIRNLAIGESSLDLLLLRHDSDVGINIIRRTGPVEICSVK
jgi:glycogen debranching enzyme